MGEVCVISNQKTLAGWIKVTLSQNLPGVWIILDLTLHNTLLKTKKSAAKPTDIIKWFITVLSTLCLLQVHTHDVASVLTMFVHLNVSFSPALILVNDDSGLDVAISPSCIMLARLTDAKKCDVETTSVSIYHSGIHHSWTFWVSKVLLPN